MTRQIKSHYDAVVIGAGIGGMLSSAFLTKKGYSTCMLEQLSFLGGKFTGFDYRGYQIPSGAFHMLPGGENGNFGRCFRDLGVDFEIVYPKDALSILEQGKRYKLSHTLLGSIKPDSYIWKFSPKELLSFLGISYYLLNRDLELPDISFNDLLKLFTTSPRVGKFFDQIMIFANGTNCEISSLIEFKESLKASNYSKEGLVKGGCRNLIKRLESRIRQKGGEIFTKTSVARIMVQKNKITGVELADGQKIKAQIVVTNVGPKRTIKLLGQHTPQWYIDKQQSFLPAYGVCYSLGSDRPLLDHGSVEASMDHNYVCGYVQVSNLDPTLAPPGKHLLLAAQMVVDPHLAMKDALAGGVRDLMDIFPGLTKENIINVSSFHRDWAGCPTGQRLGQSGPNRYPIKVAPFENFYMVSHDSQGWGFSGDLIGHAAWTFQQMI